MDGKIDNSIPRRQDVSEHVERTWEVLHETSCKCSLKDSSLLPTKMFFSFFFLRGVGVSLIYFAWNSCMSPGMLTFPVTVEIEG